MRKGMLIILCVVTMSANASDRGDWWEVNIAQGPVRGRKDPNEELYVFYNIPYATAPTGEYKFKAPLPPPTWTKPYDAIDEGVVCPQFPGVLSKIKKFKIQENCLIANVYVPYTEAKNLSVLVIVHGGVFEIGYGDFLKSKHLMEPKDLIVVTFNYRLGIHGFLCLGTADVPGNAGMKDQIALLRWVQQNIAAFGGNTNDVTITGYSSGSVSVDLLMLSKSAEGTFHKVIPQSGANLAAIAIQRNPLQNAKEYAKTLNFTNTGDICALEKFYKTLSYDNMTAKAFSPRPDSTVLFSPCIERNDKRKERRRDMNAAFLTESPLHILKTGNYKKVPLLYGFTNMDGLFRIDMFDTAWKKAMNDKFSDFLPGDLKFRYKQDKEEIAKQVKAHYFNDTVVSNDNVLRYVDYFSDVIFVYSTLKAVKLHVDAGHKQVYLYKYSFVDRDTPVVPHTNVRGAGHCAQAVALFDGKNVTYLLEDDISDKYRSMKKTVRQIWHNFIITGKPVPKGSFNPAWPAVGADGSPYMSLAQKLELRGLLSEEVFCFWENLYEKYYRDPLPTPRTHC